MKHLDTEEDPLTSFMFGKSKYTKKQAGMNEFDKIESNEFNHTITRNKERDWLFGAREDQEREKKPDMGALAFLNNMNLGELIENVEILMDSADQLKPLYKKASPIISKFLKRS